MALLDGRELTESVEQAAQLLASVVGQDLEQTQDGVFRIARKVAKDRIISTVDQDARHGHKTSARGFDGYKGHVAVDPDSEIVTDTTVTTDNVGDATVAQALIYDLLDQPDADGAVDETADEHTEPLSEPAGTPAGDEQEHSDRPVPAEEPAVYGAAVRATASPTSAMGAPPARCARSALLQQRDAQSASAVMSSGCATHAPSSGNRTGKPTTGRPGRKSNASSGI